MAKARVIYPPTAPPPPLIYQLDLTEDEAMFLRRLTGSLCGEVKTGPGVRPMNTLIYNQLCAVLDLASPSVPNLDGLLLAT